jgi:proline dehydrogenase
MNSFQNTEIAFRHLSNFELRKMFWLFRAFSFLWFVRAGKSILAFATRFYLPYKWIIKPTVFRQFCGGETLEEVSSAINSLSAIKMKAVLDYSAEGKETEENFSSAFAQTVKTIVFSANNPNIPFTVFKPSAFEKVVLLDKVSNKVPLTEEENYRISRYRNRIDQLCKTASDLGIPIMIDAEHTYYQPIVDELCDEMSEKYNSQKAIVYNTLQMYRTDRLEYLKSMLQKATDKKYYLGIKFVRGAYMEKERERAARLKYPSPIQPDKSSTDRDYNEALSFSVQHIDRISIFNGTHNEESCLLLTELMRQAGLPNNDPRIWFSQLYGMSDNISANLASEGYRVVKYVPYGPINQVLPYLIRRAEENTSMKGQTSRELNYIITELKRRKNQNTHGH